MWDTTKVVQTDKPQSYVLYEAAPQKLSRSPKRYISTGKGEDVIGNRKEARCISIPVEARCIEWLETLDAGVPPSA
jgi:hypothetical protein